MPDKNTDAASGAQDALEALESFVNVDADERADHGPRNLPAPSKRKKARVRSRASKRANRPHKFTRRKRRQRVAPRSH